MEFSREKMLAVLNEAYNLAPEKFFIAEAVAQPKFQGVQLQIPRFIMPLTSEKRISYFGGGTLQDRIFAPGEVLLCHRRACCREFWDRKHRMLSVGFWENYIRVIYISHEKSSTERSGPDIFFHTSWPLSGAGLHIMQGLFGNLMNEETRKLLFMALLQELIAILETDRDKPPERDEYILECARIFMEDNLSANIGRDDVAYAVHISSSYLTKLLRQHYGCGFSDFLTRIRMEQAVRLLNDPEIAIQDVATQCGFSWPSYFIRIFRKSFGVTPMEYRAQKNDKLKNLLLDE